MDINTRNLEAICTALKFDGDFILGPVTGNQCDKMGVDYAGNDMWYVSLNEPAGDCEAYVIADAHGNVSYYDHTHEVIVINNQLNPDRVRSSWKDRLDDLVDLHRLESGQVKPEAITAYLALLVDGTS